MKKRSIPKRAYSMKEGEEEQRSQRAKEIVASKKTSGIASPAAHSDGNGGPELNAGAAKRGRGRPRKRRDDTIESQVQEDTRCAIRVKPQSRSERALPLTGIITEFYTQTSLSLRT
ncbi:Uncharacterized protein PBTT_09652 [Plasmodiophora brassicae]